MPDDVEGFLAVLEEVAAEGALATAPPIDRDARRAGALAAMDPEGPEALFVLEDGDRVVGAAGLQAGSASGVMSLGMMVLRDARGRGGGRALLAALVEHATSAGAHKLELEVFPDNAAAIALYASSGFELEGLRRGHYRRRDGSVRSSLLMARLLER